MTRRSNLVLVGGGARSGKSAFAIAGALEHGPRRLFVATAEAFDAEMRVRIDAHVAQRGTDFETIEAPLDLESALAQREDVDVVVIDCLTLWISNLLMADVPPERIEQRVDALATTLSAAPFVTWLVTNEVGLGLVPQTALGRLFRDVAGRAHQRLSRAAGEVYLAALGCMLRIKPSPIVSCEGPIA